MTQKVFKISTGIFIGGQILYRSVGHKSNNSLLPNFLFLIIALYYFNAYFAKTLTQNDQYIPA